MNKTFDELYVIKYNEWAEALRKLNNHINSLTEWNEYAQDCQTKYDELLKRDPRLKHS